MKAFEALNDMSLMMSAATNPFPNNAELTNKKKVIA